MDPCYPGEEHRADDGSGEPSHLLGELPTSACEWFDCSFTTLPSFKVVATWMALLPKDEIKVTFTIGCPIRVHYLLLVIPHDTPCLYTTGAVYFEVPEE
jgi:hypothetical protein